MKLIKCYTCEHPSLSMASPYHCITGQPLDVVQDRAAGLQTTSITDNQQGLMSELDMTPPAGLQPQSIPLSKPIVQPHMFNINTTGTSGFRSPVTPLCAASQNNTSFLPLNASQTNVPFPSDTSTSGYQFPSPAVSVQTVNSGISTGSMQPFSQTVTWPGLEAWTDTHHTSIGAERARQIKLRHGKRKILHYDDGPGHSPKIFIDEERMSAHLQELNLDNNNINWQHTVEQQPWYSQQNNNNNTVEYNVGTVEQEMSDVEDSLPQLELSDEVKRSIETNELLPKTVIQEITKPCMQIVLWKPPEDLSKKEILHSQSSNSSSSSETPHNEQPSADMEVLDENQSENNNVILTNVPDISMAPPGEQTGNNTHLFDSLDTDIDL